MRPRLLSVLIGSIFSGVLVSSGAAAAAMKFDVGMFSSGGSKGVDFSRFDKGNVVLPGTYGVEVVVNENMQGRRDVTFSVVDGQDSATACFDRALLVQLGVDPEKVARGDGTRSETEAAANPIPDGPLCGDLGIWIPGATASFDAGEQVLSVSVPQIYMNQSARGYVDPSQWDNGVNAALLGYNFSTSTATSGGGGSQSYLGLNGGINVGDWRLRHQGAQAWNSNTGRVSYQNTATYLQRSLADLKSQLIVGDSFTSGQIMDSVRLRGVSIATDDRMLPQSQQGYAPVVRGNADSNARVTITQNGYKIYETTVSPGPFVIDDLFPTGYGGDLDVTVTEADGRKNTFVVPFAALPQLLRADTTKYSVAAGQLKQHSVDDSTPFVMQASIQHGVSNAVTLYGGATVTSGYTQAKGGTAISTPIGAISLDATVSRTSVPGNNSLSGQSYGISYNKNMPETGTNFALGAYRFSTDGYLNLADAVNVRDLGRRGEDINQYARQKSRLDINLSQKLGDGTLSLFGSSIDYWNSSQGRQTSFTAGYGSTWQRINWNLSVQRSRIQDSKPLSMQEQSDDVFFGPSYNKGRIDNRIMLTLSMPLGQESRAPNLTSSMSRNTGDSRGSNLQVGVNGNVGEQRNMSYGVSASRNGNDGGSSESFNAYGGYQASAANLRAGYSQSRNSGQLSFSADGGVVAHGGGVAFSQGLGDTVGLVHVPDAEGALLTSASGVKVDSRGYAVVPYMTPFQNNIIGIDPKGMSEHVELKESTQTVAPTLGAVSLIKFATVSGRAVIVKAMQEDGKPLPFAAQVFDESGTEVGVVGQASKAFVRGIADRGLLTVKWGESVDRQCRISYQLPAQVTGKRQATADVVEGQCVSSRDAGVAASSAEIVSRAIDVKSAVFNENDKNRYTEENNFEEGQK